MSRSKKVIIPKKLRLSGAEKDMQKAVDFAEANGFTAERTAGYHIKFSHPSGAVTFGSSTPRNHYAADQAISQMKRALREKMAGK